MKQKIYDIGTFEQFTKADPEYSGRLSSTVRQRRLDAFGIGLSEEEQSQCRIWLLWSEYLYSFLYSQIPLNVTFYQSDRRRFYLLSEFDPENK